MKLGEVDIDMSISSHLKEKLAWTVDKCKPHTSKN